MSDERGIPRAEVTIDELADLQAGLLSADEEQVLRARIVRDPGAARLWAALEDTRTLLGDLSDEPIPDDVAARINAAITAESHHSAAGDAERGQEPMTPADATSSDRGVVDLDASHRRRRMPGWVTPVTLIGAAAVVVGFVASTVFGSPPPKPQPGAATLPVTLTAGQLAQQWPSIRDSRDLGFLGGENGKLDKCLTGLLSPLDPRLFGARPVIVDGRYGILIATQSATDSTQVSLLVLGPQCDTATDHDLIAHTSVPQ